MLATLQGYPGRHPHSPQSGPSTCAARSLGLVTTPHQERHSQGWLYSLRNLSWKSYISCTGRRRRLGLCESVTVHTDTDAARNLKLFIEKKPIHHRICHQVRSYKTYCLFLHVPGSKLALGGTGFGLQVQNLFHNPLNADISQLKTKKKKLDKSKKEGHLLRTSFNIHRPVWITAGGATYTTLAAVYLTLRCLRHV